MTVELDKETIAYLSRLIKRGGHQGEQARDVLKAAGLSDNDFIAKEEEERDSHGRWTSSGTRAAASQASAAASSASAETKETRSREFNHNDVSRGGAEEFAKALDKSAAAHTAAADAWREHANQLRSEGKNAEARAAETVANKHEAAAEKHTQVSKDFSGWSRGVATFTQGYTRGVASRQPDTVDWRVGEQLDKYNAKYGANK